MSNEAFKPNQIINKMRAAETLLKKGLTIQEVSDRLAISKQTYLRWRKEFASMWTVPFI